MLLLSESRQEPFTIIKHFYFKNKLKPAIFKQYCYGTAHKLTFAHPKIGVKVFQYTFENLEGNLFLCWQLSPEAKSGKETTSNLSDKTDEEVEAGFEYIAKEAAPLNGVKLLLWQTKALKNDTPIRNWPIPLVKEIVRLIQTEGCLVKKEYEWPLTLMHMQQWVLDILEDVWDFDTVALALLGASGCGKSPVGRTVLNSQCRRNKRNCDTAHLPCIRVTTEFDFLRGEPGNIVMGDFLDDGSVFMILLKLLLAFTDVGLFEAMAWARWGMTKWVQGQPRGFSDNAHYPIDTKNEWPSLTHDEFVQVIRPSLHEKASDAHVDAMLKRAAYIVVTKGWVCWRPAGVEHVEVKRRFMQNIEMLTEEGKELYGKYRNGCRDFPANHEENVRLEQVWVDRVLEKNQQRRHDRHLAATAPAPLFPVRRRGDSPMAVVKLEKAKSFWRLKAKPASGPISLDSPSPVKKKVRAMPTDDLPDPRNN